jgi:hypothetical protein
VSNFYRLVCALFLILMSTVVVSRAWAGIGFQPVSADELKMTSEPQAPGAPAIILYRQVDRDDNGRTSHEDQYYRIKILTEAGRKYADIEIPFLRDWENVVNIRARTIRPDGSIVDFDGKIFDKTLVKAKGVKYLAKTFTLSDVQVGSIIEFYYTDDLEEYSLFSSHWIVSEELFTKRAQFSLKPYELKAHESYFPNPFRLRWTWHGLPAGIEPQKGGDGIVRIEVKNIPAFPTEDFMPPANELKARVDFIYADSDDAREPDKFWRQWGKKRYEDLESFVGKRKAMEAIVAQIVSSSDAPEVKLRKIYDRVQAIRNTTFEVRKTEQEEKRAKEKPPNNVEEMWKRGYGDSVTLPRLFLALVRAAGFDARECWVSDRRMYFFVPITMEGRKLNANVVVVKLNGKDLYLDPGIPFTSFGLLPWSETGTPGLLLDKEGGTWVRTVIPARSESRVDHNARLKLTDAGDLEGKVTVNYSGLEAMNRRMEKRNSDAVERKKFLEDELKGRIPVAAEVELTNTPDWSNSETRLVAEFTLKIPGWAAAAGRREVVSAGVFSAEEKHVFEHANRVHPIYFDYSFEKEDDVSIDLPAGWHTSSIPAARNQDGHIVSYSVKVDELAGTLHLVRKLGLDAGMYDPKYYTGLRNFFQNVKSGDEQQIVLQPGSVPATK